MFRSHCYSIPIIAFLLLMPMSAAAEEVLTGEFIEAVIILSDATGEEPRSIIERILEPEPKPRWRRPDGALDLYAILLAGSSSNPEPGGASDLGGFGDR